MIGPFVHFKGIFSFYGSYVDLKLRFGVNVLWMNTSLYATRGVAPASFRNSVCYIFITYFHFSSPIPIFIG